MVAENYTALDYYRYERKFVGDVFSLKRAEMLLKVHPELFWERYQSRQVNNIYFDTPSLEYFADNHQGKDNRVKYRIRWYGAIKGMVEPILEIKIKKGLVGIKRSYSLKSFLVDDSLTKADLIKVVSQSEVPADVIEKFKHLEPVLLNAYTRRYFENFSRKFRITFDTHLCYFQFNRTIQFGNVREDKSKLVIEMKYDHKYDNEAAQIAQLLPFRMSKNSKYVSGIECFYPGIAL